MQRIRSLIRFWPLLFFFVLTGVLFYQNYIPGTYLTGWDNLHPEYNFLLNIKRSLFAVWQEYQGLGLLGGHAHSSDFPRQLALYLASFFLPNSVLRYLSTFAMLFLGSVGAYFLSRRLLFPDHPRSLSVIVGLFYLCNLATVQAFYVPFESFIAHFAALPWLLLASVQYFLRPTRSHLWQLIIVLLLSLPAVYIPTLFVVYLMALSIFLLPFLFSDVFRIKEGNHIARIKDPVLRAVKLYTVIFLINSFWLFPFMFFTATNAQVNLQSKINQSATQTIFLQNKEYGGIFDLMILRGFWFKNVDPNFDGIFTYMLTPWQNHFGNPLVLILGYLFFAIVLVGLVRTIKSRSPLMLSWSLLFIFVCIALAVATPPFSWINTLIRESVPLLNQAFRFPFTKFSVLAGLVFAVLFGYGLQAIILNLSPLISMRKPMLTRGVALIATLLLFFYALPFFQGHLLYEKERIPLPEEYKKLFVFFQNQDPNTRIANLPQHTFWGWNFYRFGYGGSGFLWYGIKQPILDRAFDVWSKTDENYYYELSNALYSKNPQLLEEVINKYQISWLLIDKNIIYPPSPKALLLEELEPLIQQVPGTKKAAQFGNIIVYNTTLKDSPRSFVFTTPNLPTANVYSWNHYDKAYSDLGDYITANDPTDYYYPFRSLFTEKTESEREFLVQDNGPTVTFSQTLPKNFSKSPLRIPSLLEKETILPVTIHSVLENGTLTIYSTIQAPQITLGNQSVGGEISQKTLFSVKVDPAKNSGYILNTNGVINFPVPVDTKRVGTTFLPLSEVTRFTLTDAATGTSSQASYSPSEIASLPFFKERTLTTNPTQPQTLTITIPKIDDSYLSATLNPDKFSKITNCDNFRKGTVESKVTEEQGNKTLTLTSKNATACVPFFLPTLAHREGYAIFITSSNQEGRSLHFWMENTDAKSGSLDTYLPEGKTQTDTAFILPPLEEFGNSYALHFDNISIGKDVSTNTLKRVSIYPIPYAYLTSLVFAAKEPTVTATGQTALTVEHPNESLYRVQVTKNQEPMTTLVLSQSYDPGWQAYVTKNYESRIMNQAASVFPFLSGKRLEHVKVNNWENGWKLDSPQTTDNKQQIVIVYLPQYLQYVGFVILLSVIIYLLLPEKIRHPKS